MATVGSMGKIVFNTSSRRVMTFDNFNHNIGVNVSNHDIIGKKPTPELTGLASDEVTFDILLRKQNNVSPTKKLSELKTMCETGKVFPLIIGGKPVSDNYWMLTKVGTVTNYFGKSGEMISISVSVTLQEYPIEQASTAKPKSKLVQIQERIDSAKNRIEIAKDKYLDTYDKFEDMTGGLF